MGNEKRQYGVHVNGSRDRQVGLAGTFKTCVYNYAERGSRGVCEDDDASKRVKAREGPYYLFTMRKRSVFAKAKDLRMKC